VSGLRCRVENLKKRLRGGGAECAVDGSFGNAGGTRRYRLYRPGWRYLGPRPLVVMLHGCRQTSEDFALGTRMHARSTGLGCFVVYPAQDPQANRQGCWNWYEQLHQQADSGEPAILAGMVRELLSRHRIDRRRVYVAGLSAGGAMAAILAATHPRLFAAVGIHSGLPHAVASTLGAAVTVMRRGPGRDRTRQADALADALPLIVFHGDQDDTVHPTNGEELIARTRPGTATRTIRGAVAGGRAWTRTVYQGADGRCHAEHWVVHGSGHAWSGGDPAGSYTDPLGPDASREMLRFFAEHSR
jgi:poly(hydroxyalkanoate) depolymerase family esterase